MESLRAWDAGNPVEHFGERPTRNDSGGCFVLDRRVFDLLEDGDAGDLEIGALERIAEQRELRGYRHRGQWACTGAARERDHLHGLWGSDAALLESQVAMRGQRRAFERATVLVAGDTGFKGRWLARWLTRLGANVVGDACDGLCQDVASLGGQCDAVAQEAWGDAAWGHSKRAGCTGG
jgi:hypothetical protein